jgi:hypothetical protein
VLTSNVYLHLLEVNKNIGKTMKIDEILKLTVLSYDDWRSVSSGLDIYLKVSENEDPMLIH